MKKKNLNSQGFTPHPNFSFLIVVFVVLCAGLGGFVYMHEQIHVAHFKQAGINSTISFDLAGGHTMPEAKDFSSIQEKERVMLLQGFTESVGYQIVPLAVMLCGIIIACTIYLGGKLEK